MSDLQLLADLGQRFTGIDLQHRRDNTKIRGWPMPWRVRLLTSKNERCEYRITVFGRTLDDAIENLRFQVSELDRQS